MEMKEIHIWVIYSVGMYIILYYGSYFAEMYFQTEALIWG